MPSCYLYMCMSGGYLGSWFPLYVNPLSLPQPSCFFLFQIDEVRSVIWLGILQRKPNDQLRHRISRGVCCSSVPSLPFMNPMYPVRPLFQSKRGKSRETCAVMQFPFLLILSGNRHCCIHRVSFLSSNHSLLFTAWFPLSRRGQAKKFYRSDLNIEPFFYSIAPALYLRS